MTTNTLTMILGGGVGSRLYPLTKHRAKPAVPLGANYRLIDVPISNALNSNCSNIYVLTQFNSKSLNAHITKTYGCFGSHNRGFVEIIAANQSTYNKNWFQGTADAIRQNVHILENHIEQDNIENVLILSGDHLYRMDYSKFIDNHNKHHAAMTIATKTVHKNEAHKYGIVSSFKGDNKSNEITHFKEKPVPEVTEHYDTYVSASMGIYVFNAKILIEILAKYNEFEDFGNEIIPAMIAEKYRTYKYEFDDHWADIGTISSFYEANMRLCEHNPTFEFYNKDFPIYKKHRNLPPSKITNSFVDKSIIGDGSYIDTSHISNSVIGVRSKIDKQCNIMSSIIMGNDNYSKSLSGIGRSCTIANSIIDKNVNIGNKVKLVNYNSVNEYCNPKIGLYVKDKIMIVEKGAIIPDNFRF